jgi:hypothetical protein
MRSTPEVGRSAVACGVPGAFSHPGTHGVGRKAGLKNRTAGAGPRASLLYLFDTPPFEGVSGLARVLRVPFQKGQ